VSAASNRGCTPWLQDADVTLYHGDALAVLRELPDESVDCCVTSPPYWGLRDYGQEGQLGLEPTPEEYVIRMVDVFHEVRRVTAPHGTVWLNLGDSYVSGQGGRQSAHGELPSTSRKARTEPKPRPELPNSPSGWAERAVAPRWFPSADTGWKPKDLTGIPWMVAFALRADGWYLRSDIIWAKPNPMPESVTDRPTKAHEYVFLLSKQPRYFFDQEAVREDAQWRRWGTQNAGKYADQPSPARAMQSLLKQEILDKFGSVGRNIRSVWEIATQPCSETHFATFPEELARRCIAAGCPENGTVLDPFIGSGTVAYVARKLGRHAIGIDLNESYLQLAARRLQQQSLFAEAAGA